MVNISSVLLKAGVSLMLTVNVARIDTNNLIQENELIEGKVTVYCDEGITASGTRTREGICASSQDRIGKLIVLYKRLPDGKVGDIIGYYDCEDTGSTDSIINGTVIDVWKSEEDMKEFIDLTYEDACNGNVYIQVFDAK